MEKEEAKTAEEILKRHTFIDGDGQSGWTEQGVINAMESYASQFKSPYPKMMMVWDNMIQAFIPRWIIAEHDGKFIGILNAASEKEAKNEYQTTTWQTAKDI